MDEQVVATNAPSEDAQKRIARERFMRLALERFQLAAEAEQRTRTDALDDLEFRSGKQWPDDITTQRGLDGRPCLTINRLPPIIRQVTNEQRQQRPSIQINPVGSGADQDTAEIIQGIIRHIEVNSDAEIAYDTAFESAVTIGFGYWCLDTDYIRNTFDLDIFIRRIRNPFRVYFDPSAIEPCYEDASWAFEIEDMPIAEYKRTFPNSELAALVDFESVGDQAPDWATKDTIRVAMYWHVEEKQRELVKLANGKCIFADEVQKGDEVVDRRKLLDRKVIKSKINAVEVLEETEWPCNWIGIVPVLADDLDVDGKRYLAGIVRDAKDPQRMYNYWNSSATETIALAPRAPYIAPVGSFENQEGKWAMANVRNMPYLEYNPTSVAGSLNPTPQRQQYEPPIQAMNLMLLNASNDLKAVTGVYDPSLGQNKSDQSGRAVQLLQKQSDVSNMHFVDNMSRSMRHTGRMIIDMLKIYDAPRVQRIFNPDQSTDHVIVHNGNGDAAKGLGQQNAIDKIYDLGVGVYDVTVSVGPSYQSKRQESVASIMALVKEYPQIMQFAGDILIQSMDWPGAKEIAERAKKLLPPQLQDQGDMSVEAQLQRAQQQLQQLSQQHQMMTEALNNATDMIKTERVKQEAQIAIADLNNKTKIAIAEITSAAQDAKVRAETTSEIWRELHGSAHDLGMQAEQHAHEKTLQESEQEAALEQVKAQPQPTGAE